MGGNPVKKPRGLFQKTTGNLHRSCTMGLRESLKPSYFEAFLALTALFLDVGVLGYTFKQVLNMTNLFEL